MSDPITCKCGEAYYDAKCFVAHFRECRKAYCQAPASGEVEPIGFLCPDDVAELKQGVTLIPTHIGSQYDEDAETTVPVFTHPPAKVPDRLLYVEDGGTKKDDYVNGWNECIDAMLTTTPQPADNWIKCSERLPTEADADYNGHVWYHPVGWDDGLGPVRDTWHFVATHAKVCKTMMWMPTGLKRPEPPTG